MTNKEFEDKKQDIFKNLDKALGFLQNEDLYKCSNIIWDTMKDLKQLQPPKPPACSTCKHTVPIYNMFKSKILWRECKKVKLFKSSVGNATELPTGGWGCTRHSDYEVAE